MRNTLLPYDHITDLDGHQGNIINQHKTITMLIFIMNFNYELLQRIPINLISKLKAMNERKLITLIYIVKSVAS